MVTPVKRRRCPMTPDKDCYRSEHDVAVASRHIEFRRGVRLYYYFCDWCDHWHLTKTPNEHS
jgi:hypothetical protein